MGTAGSDEAHRFWLAGKFLNKIYTNYDVTQYMERAILDDAQRGQLFKEAGGDFNKYKGLVRKHTAGSFEAALRFLMYNKILEHHATSGKDIKEWKAFKISPNDYYKQIEKLEDELIVPLIRKKGLRDINEARELFGAYLKEQNFPHKSGESDMDIYFRWYNDQKFRLKHELRTQEAKRYEAIAAMGYRRELYVRPTDQNSFYKDGKRKIESDLHGQEMTPGQVSDYLRKNPELKVIMKDVAYLSLGSAPLARILEESESEFEKAKKTAIDGILPSLTDDKISKIIKYEGLAAKMAAKYKDAEKLNAASKSAMERFVNTGEYKEIMKAKIYSLAAVLVESNYDRTNISTDLTLALNLAMEDLKKKLDKKETYMADSVKKLLFEDLIVSVMKETLTKELGEKYNGYLRRALNMGIWTIEFDAKKFSFSTTPRVAVEVRPYMDWETQKKIQEYLKMKQFEKLMNDFRERELRRDVEGLFAVDPDGRAQLTGRQAYDWLIQD